MAMYATNPEGEWVPIAEVAPDNNGRLRCKRCSKVAYPNMERATKVALKIGDRSETKMRPYFDPRCGWCHVTRSGGERWYRLQREEQEPPSEPKMEPIVLRDYQQASVEGLYKYFVEHKGNPVVALPTGTGKSIVIAEFIRDAMQRYPGTRVMMLTHVKELIGQNADTILRMWPTAPLSVFSAGLKRKENDTNLVFAGIQSVHRNFEQFGHIDLVLIDECHLVNPKGTTMYRKFLEGLRKTNPNLKVIGFSATPFRLGQGMLTDTKEGLFTHIAFDMTGRKAFNWLIQEGYLCPLLPKQPSVELPVQGVPVRQGEYVLKDLQAAVDRAAITRSALNEAALLAEDRNHWLVFASGIDHAEHIATMLEDEFNIPAAAVHSRLDDKTRDQYIRQFRSGRIRALVNNNILTTGFDFPEIDCIVMLRPTASPGLWVQMLGRGTRPANGKTNCLVLDYAGNTRRLGPINDPVLPRPRGKGTPGPAPVRLCEQCQCYSHASARFCMNPMCGAEFPIAVKIESSASMRQLIAGDAPEIHTLDVSYVTYKVHKKKNRPNSMRVTYYCGLRRINDYVCLDHPGYASHIARQWWEMRCPWGAPPSTEAGMSAVSHLRVPKRITVVKKGKYPEITGYEFD